jgi:predicted nuclease with TOPRIM domain
MSTTKELIDIIVELKSQIQRKEAIIEKLQEYVSKNSVNKNENMISLKEYDKLVEKNVELEDELELLKEKFESLKALKSKYYNFEYDTGHAIPQLDDHNWG